MPPRRRPVFLVRALAAGVLAGLAVAPAGVAADTLTVRVTGFEALVGDLHAAVYDDPTTFPKRGRMRVKAQAPLTAAVAEIAFPGLVVGRRYAVAVFHDANGNGVFDQTVFGIPVERYGFSRNARALFGPPAFEAAAVTLPADGLTVEIDLAN